MSVLRLLSLSLSISCTLLCASTLLAQSPDTARDLNLLMLQQIEHGRPLRVPPPSLSRPSAASTGTIAGSCPPGGCIPSESRSLQTIREMSKALPQAVRTSGCTQNPPSGGNGRSACTGRGYIYPVPQQFSVNSEYGVTRTIRGRRAVHRGLDIAAPPGTAVFAVKDGEVVNAPCGNGFGECLMIEHSDGKMTLYAHMQKNCRSYNDIRARLRERRRVRVSQGDQIGCVGSTGRSTGPHLHFELRDAGRLPQAGVRSGIHNPMVECGYDEL